MNGAPDSERKKLVLTISSNAGGDRSTIGFTIANAALSAGMEVLVFLVSDGVELAREGSADAAHFPPFKPLGELVDAFTAAGGTLVACGSCFQYRGLQPQSAAEGAQIAGIGTLIGWLQSGPAVISL